MGIVYIILIILALVCLLVAAATSSYSTTEGSRPGWARTNWLALGIAFWILVTLLQMITGVTR